MAGTVPTDRQQPAVVDGLAVSVGGLLERFPDEVAPSLEAWAQDEDDGVRRASLLAYLVILRAADGDVAGFARKADRMLEESDLFMRKAIGWVLRDTGRRRPERSDLTRARRPYGRIRPPAASARLEQRGRTRRAVLVHGRPR